MKNERLLSVVTGKITLGALSGWAPLLGAALLPFTTGCGMMSALANPKAAWALQEPAPMSVVLRRADAARATGMNVQRLLGSTGVDPESKWVSKIGLKKADVEAMLKEIGSDAEYTSPGGAKLRIVVAEAWAKSLSDVCSTESKSASLLSALNPEAGTAFAGITAQGQTLAKLKSDKAAEEQAQKQEGISAAEVAEHDKKRHEIDAQIEKTEAEYKPKIAALLAKIKAEGGKAPAETKAQLGVALASLRSAVEDAKLSNSVALVRYPLAFPRLKDELKPTVTRFVGDVVEEKTGSRPSLGTFEAKIELNGTTPKVELNGLPPEALAKIEPKALTEAVTGRATDWVTKVLTLVPYVSTTQEQLDLESDVIDAALQSIGGGAKGTGGDDLVDIKVELGSGGLAVGASAAGGVTAPGGKSSRHPIPTKACEAPPPPPVVEAPAAPPTPPPAEEPKATKGAKGKATGSKGAKK